MIHRREARHVQPHDVHSILRIRVDAAPPGFPREIE